MGARSLANPSTSGAVPEDIERILRPFSQPLAKNYNNKIIFLGSFAAGESCVAPPVAENF